MPKPSSPCSPSAPSPHHPGDMLAALERHYAAASRIADSAAVARPVVPLSGACPDGLLAGQILMNAGDEWACDGAAEVIAVDYVRYLESIRAAAADMPSRFTRTPDGHRARVGQLQVTSCAPADRD